MAAPTFFLAGIIQGSKSGLDIHGQEYRGRMEALLRDAFPDADIFDPVQCYPGSVSYSPEKGRAAFFDLMDRAGRTDVLVAFVPEASMGTAIELWRAREAGAVVVCVSPLVENWVVKFLPDVVLPDFPALEAFVRDGRMAALIHRGTIDN